MNGKLCQDNSQVIKVGAYCVQGMLMKIKHVHNITQIRGSLVNADSQISRQYCVLIFINYFKKSES